MAFDPIVAELERHREDKQWERHYFEQSHPEFAHSADSAPGEESQPEWEEFMDAEDYLNDEEKFNITNRLVSSICASGVQYFGKFLAEMLLAIGKFFPTILMVMYKFRTYLCFSY